MGDPIRVPPVPGETEAGRAFWRALRARHPPLREAVVADARITARYRGERDEFTSRRDAAAQMLRLALVSDAYLGQVLYRLKASLQRRGVPILPRIAHRLAMAVAQVSIGDPVLVHPGAVIGPFVTIGLRAGDVRGATIERGASLGTGAKVIGAVRIGAGATVVGAPARPVSGDRASVS